MFSSERPVRQLHNHPDAHDIDVSGDGACLFYSIAFSVLIPVVNNKHEFGIAYKTLFGEASADVIESARQLLFTYDGSKQFILRNEAKSLRDAISKKFRHCIVDHMIAHKEKESFGKSDRDGFKDFPDEDGEVKSIEPYARVYITPEGSEASEKNVPGTLYIQLGKDSAFYHALGTNNPSLKSGIELHDNQYQNLQHVLTNNLTGMLQPGTESISISSDQLVTDIRTACGLTKIEASFDSQMKSMKGQFKAGGEREIMAAFDILAPLGIDIFVHTFKHNQALENAYKRNPEESKRSIDLIHDLNSNESRSANHYRYFLDESYLHISNLDKKLRDYQPAATATNEVNQKKELIDALEKNRDITSEEHIDDARLYHLVLFQLCKSDDDSNNYRAVLYDFLRWVAGKLTKDRGLIARIDETIKLLENPFWSSGYKKPEDAHLAIFNEVFGEKITQTVPVHKPEIHVNSETVPVHKPEINVNSETTIETTNRATTSPQIPEMKKNPVNPQEIESRKKLADIITAELQQFVKNWKLEKIDAISQTIATLINVTENYRSLLPNTSLSREELLTQFNTQLSIINDNSHKLAEWGGSFNLIDVDKIYPYKIKGEFLELLKVIITGIKQNTPELIRMPGTPSESSSASPLSQSSGSMSDEQPGAEVRSLRLPRFADTTYDIITVEEINARSAIRERKNKMLATKNLPTAISEAVSAIICDYNDISISDRTHDLENVKKSISELSPDLKNQSDYINLSKAIDNIETAILEKRTFTHEINSINDIAKTIKVKEQYDRARFNQLDRSSRRSNNDNAVALHKNVEDRTRVRAAVNSLLRPYKPESHRAVKGIGKTCEAISLNLLWPHEGTESSHETLEQSRREYSENLIASQRDDAQKKYLTVATSVFQEVTEYVNKRKASFFLFRWIDNAREGQIKKLFAALSAFIDKKSHAQHVAAKILETRFKEILDEIANEFWVRSPETSDLYKIVRNAYEAIKTLSAEEAQEEARIKAEKAQAQAEANESIINDYETGLNSAAKAEKAQAEANKSIINDYETGLNSAANIGTRYATTKIHTDTIYTRSEPDVYYEENDPLESTDQAQIKRDINQATRSIDKTKHSQDNALRFPMAQVLTQHLKQCDLIALANILQTNLADGLYDVLTDADTITTSQKSSFKKVIEAIIADRLDDLLEDLLLSDMHSIDDRDKDYDERLNNCCFKHEIYQLNKAAKKMYSFPFIQKLPENSVVRLKINAILEQKAKELLIKIYDSLLSNQSLYEHDLTTYHALINHSINRVFVLKIKNGDSKTKYPEKIDKELSDKINKVHKHYLMLLSASKSLTLFNNHMLHVAKTNMAIVTQELNRLSQPSERNIAPESNNADDRVESADDSEILNLNRQVRDRHIYLLLSSGTSLVSEIAAVFHSYAGLKASPYEVIHVFNQALNDFCMFHNYDYLHALGKEQTINDENQKRRTRDLSSSTDPRAADRFIAHPFLYTCATKDTDSVAALVEKVHILLSFQKNYYSSPLVNNQEIEIFLGTYFSFLMRTGNNSLIESEIRKLQEKGFTSIAYNSLSGKISFKWTNLFNDELSKFLTSVPTNLTGSNSHEATARTIAYMFCSDSEQNTLEGAIQYRNALFAYINHQPVKPLTVKLTEDIANNIASSLATAVSSLINTLIEDNKIEQLSQIMSLKTNKPAGYDQDKCLSYVYPSLQLLADKMIISNEMYSVIANHTDFIHFISKNRLNFDSKFLHTLYLYANDEAKSDLLKIAIAKLNDQLLNGNFKNSAEFIHGYEWVLEANYQNITLKANGQSWDKLFSELHNHYVHTNDLEEHAAIKKQLDFITHVYCSASSNMVFKSTIQSNSNVEQFMSLLTSEFLSSKSKEWNILLIALKKDLLNCDDLHKDQLSKFITNYFNDASIKYNDLRNSYEKLHTDNEIANVKTLATSEYNEADIRQLINISNIYLTLKSAGTAVPVADGFVKCVEDAINTDITPQLYNGSIFFSGTSKPDSIHNLDVSKRKIYENYLLLNCVMFKTCHRDSSAIDIGLDCIRSAYIAHGAAGLSVTEEMDKFRYDALEQFSSFSDLFPSSFMGHHTFTTNSRNSKSDSEFRKICRKEYANENISIRILKSYFSLLQTIKFNATQHPDPEIKEICSQELYYISEILLELHNQSTIINTEALFKNLQFRIGIFLNVIQSKISIYTNTINAFLFQLNLGYEAQKSCDAVNHSSQAYTYLDKQYYILNLLTQDDPSICLSQRMKLAHAELISLIEVNAQFNPEILHSITESIGMQYTCNHPGEIANYLSAYMTDEVNTDLIIKKIQSMSPVNIFTKLQEELENYLERQSRTTTDSVKNTDLTYIEIINTHLMSDNSGCYEQALGAFNCTDFKALNQSTLQDLFKYAATYTCFKESEKENVQIKYMISALLYTHLGKMIDAQKKPGIKSLQASLISVSNIIELMNLIDSQLNFIKKSGVKSSEFVELLRQYRSSICKNQLSTLSEFKSGDLNPFKNTISLVTLEKHITTILDVARIVSTMSSNEFDMLNELKDHNEFTDSFRYCLSFDWEHLTPQLQQFLIGISKHLFHGLEQAGCPNIAAMIKSSFFTKYHSETQMRVLAAVDRKLFIDTLIKVFDIDKHKDLARSLMPVIPDEIDYILALDNATLSVRLSLLAAISRKHFFQQALPSIHEDDALINCIDVIKSLTPLEGYEFKATVNMILQKSGSDMTALITFVSTLKDRASYFNLSSYIKNNKDLNTFLENAQKYAPITQEEFDKIDKKLFADADVKAILNLHTLLGHHHQNGNIKLDSAVKIHLHTAAQKIYANSDSGERQRFINALLQTENAVSYFVLYYPYGQINQSKTIEEKVFKITDLIKRNRYYLSVSKCKIIFESLPKEKLCEFVCNEFRQPSGGFTRTDDKMAEIMKYLLVAISDLNDKPLLAKAYHYDQAIEYLTKRLKLCKASANMDINVVPHAPQNVVNIDTTHDSSKVSTFNNYRV